MKSTFIKDLDIKEGKCVLTIFSSKEKDNSYNQHASLIVEGYDKVQRFLSKDDKPKMWYWVFDFIPSKSVMSSLSRPLDLNELVDGEIRICKFYEGQKTTESKLLESKGFTRDFLQIVLRDERIGSSPGSFKSCVIEKSQAEELRKNIEQEAKNPPKYLKSGDQAMLSKVSTLLLKKDVKPSYNCITWAEKTVADLGIDINKSFTASFVDLFLAVPSLHVQSRKEEEGMCLIL